MSGRDIPAAAGGRDILIAFGGYGQGISGAQRMAWRCVEQLAGRGHRVVVLTDARPSTLDYRGVTLVGSAAELTRTRPGWRPDLVHALDLAKPEQVEAALGLAGRFDVPLALTPCSAPGVWPDPDRGRIACGAADIVFALTGVEEDELRAAGAAPDRIRRLPHASDLVGPGRPDEFRRQHGIEGPMVLFVGRRVAFKGYRALLAAMRPVWRHLPQTHFVFIGPDADADAAARFAAHADPRLHDLGVVDEQAKHDALTACALLCLPTSLDVFPLVFIEAWACGKPVISGDFAGAGEVVRDGVDGLIVAPRPAPLTVALRALLADDAARAAMGQAGRRRATAEFGWDKVTDAYEDGYEWAIQRRRP